MPLQLHLWTFALHKVCNDATPMHCSNSEGKTASLLFSAALQNRLTAALCHCNCTYGHFLFVRCAMMQHQCIAAVVRAKQLPCCSVLLCKTGSQQDCSTAITPMDICSSHRCGVMQHQCIAAIVRAKQLPCCSVLLCKTGSQQRCATAIAPMDICSSSGVQ